jgi:antitoxin component YwqK of YwqJK toxin-antitoxin module
MGAKQTKWNLFLLFFCLVFILMPAFSTAQLFHKKVNRYDENGKRTGLWVNYWDEEEKIPMSKNHFKDDRETGVCKDYHNNGKLRLKFRYYKNRTRVKYYDEDRQIEQKGWSIMEFTKDDIHYYWHGKWKFYNQDRKLIRKSIFKDGVLIEENFINQAE